MASCVQGVKQCFWGSFCPHLSALLVSPLLHSWLDECSLATLLATPVQRASLKKPGQDSLASQYHLPSLGGDHRDWPLEK